MGVARKKFLMVLRFWAFCF